MRCLNFLAVFLTSAFAVGQTVSVGTPSTIQAGSTTTITVPVTVSGATATAGGATGLPMLSVETNTASGVQAVGAAFTTIKMGNVITDTAGAWNASTNAYTAPNTGTYLIVSKIRLSDNAMAGVSYGQGVNTSNVDGAFFVWSTTEGLRNSLANVRLVKLAAGQTVNLYAYFDGPSSVWGASLTIQELN
jgi:hypothetical protein